MITVVILCPKNVTCGRAIELPSCIARSDGMEKRSTINVVCGIMWVELREKPRHEDHTIRVHQVVSPSWSIKHRHLKKKCSYLSYASGQAGFLLASEERLSKSEWSVLLLRMGMQKTHDGAL